MNKAFIKKYGTLLLLAAGAGIIFQLPYIRETFYVPIQNAMNLTNEQMGLLSSGYAAMATLSYFVGGIIADKFFCKKAFDVFISGNRSIRTLVFYIPWISDKQNYLYFNGDFDYYHILVSLY